MLHKALDLDRFFGTIWEIKIRHEIWNFECEEFPSVRVIETAEREEQSIMSVVKRVKFVSGRMSCIMWGGCWRDIVVLNVHTRMKD
jgi:hypothetical protein